MLLVHSVILMLLVIPKPLHHLFLVVLTFVLMMFLSACGSSGGGQGSGAGPHTGTGGLQLQFGPGSPPSTVYTSSDGFTPTPFTVEVKNTGAVTTTLVDHLGRIRRGTTNMVGTSHPAVVEYNYTSDRHGIRQTITSPQWTHSGNVIVHDLLGNKTFEQFAELGSQSITYNYDNRGWLKSIIQPEGNIAFELDKSGRVMNSRRSGYSPNEVVFEYLTGFGSIKKVTHGSVVKEVTSFDEAGRPTSIKINVPGPSDRLPAPGTRIEVK